MRTGSIAARALAALALAAACRSASALELGLTAAAGNLQFPWTPAAPIVGSQFPATDYFWGGQAWLATGLGEDAAIRITYDRDPVLRNTAIAAVQFERGIAKISVGPLLGFLNSDSAPISAGISASVKLQWPGVAYVSLRSDGGTAISFLQAEADPQARTELAAGFYVPNAIVSGLISAKRFNELDPSGGLVTDTLTRYAMTVDVFKKNVPYTAMLSLGYELRSKHYATSGTTDSLGALVMGVDTTVRLNEAFTLLGGISTGAYVFGLDALQGRGPANSDFLFNASLGLSVETSAIRLPPKPPAKEAGAEPAQPPKAEPAAAPEAPAAPAREKPAFSRLIVDAGAGLYYDARITLPGAFSILGDILNLRGGVRGSVGYRLTPALSVGGEIGLAYFTMTTDGVSLSLYDLPINASLRYQLGKIGIEAFGGAFVNGVAEGALIGTPLIDVDAGARLLLGGFYAEASYVIGVGSVGVDLGSLGSIAANYPRFGAGYRLSLVK